MRWERHNSRDMAYSKWHRHLGDNVTMLDIDAVEFCNRCWSPLAIMELANDVNQKSKPFTLTLKVALACNVPGYVVLYTVDDQKPEEDCIVGFRVMKIYPEISDYNKVTPDQYKKWLQALHDNCPCLKRKELMEK